MADVEIKVTGDMEVPTEPDKLGFFQFAQQLNISTPAAKQWFGNRRENIRPWTTFFNTSNFKAPPSIPRLGKRIKRNIEYFQSNYLFVFIGLIFYCIITSPRLLIAVPVCLGIAYHLYKRQQRQSLMVLGKQVTLAQQYGAVAVFSIPLFMWAGVGAAVFWVLGASVVIIHSRAALMYRAYLKTAGIALFIFILILQTVVIDFLFFFLLYYIGASFFIIFLHATFYNIDAVEPPDDDAFESLVEV